MEGVRRKNAVGITIATPFGLQSPGFKSKVGGKYFRPRPDRSLIANNLLNNGWQDFPGYKYGDVYLWLHTTSSAEVTGRKGHRGLFSLELYLWVIMFTYSWIKTRFTKYNFIYGVVKKTTFILKNRNST